MCVGRGSIVEGLQPPETPRLLQPHCTLVLALSVLDWKWRLWTGG